MHTRQETTPIVVGGVPVGGGAPVVVQSMTRSPTCQQDRVLEEIRRLSAAGAGLVRVSVPDSRSLEGLERLVRRSPVPLIADVHYPLDLAVGALQRGAAGVRINPLTLGERGALERVIRQARIQEAAVRVGVNAGRVARGQEVSVSALLEPLWETVDRLAQGGVVNIKVSAKASHLELNTALNLGLAKEGQWPIHLGLTEAGVGTEGVVRSVAGLTPLLRDGVGDTLRISLAGDALEEVRVARSLLRSLGINKEGVEILACPMCGRAHADVGAAAKEVAQAVEGCRVPLTVAVMGCEINGPGEASRADLGVAATPRGWHLFCGGGVLEVGLHGVERLIEAVLERDRRWRRNSVEE